MLRCGDVLVVGCGSGVVFFGVGGWVCLVGGGVYGLLCVGVVVWRCGGGGVRLWGGVVVGG